ncbi:uncharacterized protein LOC101172169 isoform X3 [Oryzias latipes]
MSSGDQGLDLAPDFSLSDFHPKEETRAKVGTQSASLGLGFNSLTLDELSEELDRRTKETRRLQEEVETETREALEKFGCTYRKCSPAQTVCHDDSSEASGSLSALQEPLTPPWNQEGPLKEGGSFRMDPVDERLQQFSDFNKFSVSLQVGKTSRSLSHREITNLQEKPHEAQMEKDLLSDLRLKDSRKNVDQMEQMLQMLEDVQSIKRSVSQKLQETEEEATALRRTVESLEQTLKEACQRLWEAPRGNRTHPRLKDALEEDGVSLEKQPESEEHRELNHQERIQELISGLGQEVATLSHRLSSTKDSSVRLSIKMEQLRKLAERQTSRHRHQTSELESALSCFREKVCFLEQRLSETRLELFGSQTERNRTPQSLKDLQARLGRLKTCCERQSLSVEGDARILKEQLEVIRKQICDVWEDETPAQILLEQRNQEAKQSEEVLQGKYRELHDVLQETQQHLSRQCQTLQAEREALRLELEGKEKTINDLKLQMEKSSKKTAEHSQTIERLQHKNSLFIKQLEQHKLEIQQLRRESDLAAAECESRRLQSQKIQEETQLQLQSLSKEKKELEELHSWKKDERAGVVLKLQSQLRNAREELEKLRHTLKTLEGADRQGLQAAFDMQEEVTSRREQANALQSRIQHLEEEVVTLQQEKLLQSLELRRQLQKVSVTEEERRQLEEELKTLRSKDQQLKGRISQLEAMLHKMLESFTSCQAFLQLREQDYFRLKLQHTLDLKELQSQSLHSALSKPPPDVDSATSPGNAAPPSTPQASNTQNKPYRQQEGCSCELRSPAGGVSENRRPPREQRGAGSSSCRRRSAPGRENATTHKQEVNFGSKVRRKTFSSDLHRLQTSELKQKKLDQSQSQWQRGNAVCLKSDTPHLSFHFPLEVSSWSILTPLAAGQALQRLSPPSGPVPGSTAPPGLSGGEPGQGWCLCCR